jgi:hypothetical protein
MKNTIKVLIFPLVLLLGIYYFCYEIFWWALIMERSQWTKPQRHDATLMGGVSEIGRDLLMAIGFGK